MLPSALRKNEEKTTGEREVNQYGVDVCVEQETKIENAGVHRVNESMIITFDAKNKPYGNGFVVPKKWQELINKYWRESDRICVLQLSASPNTCADEPQCEFKPAEKFRIKISKIKMKPKNIINIKSVYVPTSPRLKSAQTRLRGWIKT